MTYSEAIYLLVKAYAVLAMLFLLVSYLDDWGFFSISQEPPDTEETE